MPWFGSNASNRKGPDPKNLKGQEAKNVKGCESKLSKGPDPSKVQGPKVKAKGSQFSFFKKKEKHGNHVSQRVIEVQ